MTAGRSDDLLREIGDLMLFRDDPGFATHVAGIESRLAAVLRESEEQADRLTGEIEWMRNELLALCKWPCPESYVTWRDKCERIAAGRPTEGSGTPKPPLREVTFVDVDVEPTGTLVPYEGEDEAW